MADVFHFNQKTNEQEDLKSSQWISPKAFQGKRPSPTDKEDSILVRSQGASAPLKHFFEFMLGSRAGKAQIAPYKIRKQHLLNLRNLFIQHGQTIYLGLRLDRPLSFEEFSQIELIPLIQHLDYLIDSLPKLCGSPQGKNKITPSPLGLVFIEGHHYSPLCTLLIPMASALAAGNQVIAAGAKELPNFTSALQQFLHKTFERFELRLIHGDPEIIQAAKDLPFDLHYRPKAPPKVMAIANEDVNWNKFVADVMKAKWPLWGQFQSAPQFIFVPHQQLNLVIQKFKTAIEERFISSPACLEDKPVPMLGSDNFQLIDQIINQAKSLPDCEIHWGGDRDTIRNIIGPTLITGIYPHQPLFDKAPPIGPVLMILSYQDLDDLMIYLNGHGPAVQLHLYTNQEKTIQSFHKTVQATNLYINHFTGSIDQHEFQKFNRFRSLIYARTLLKNKIINILNLKREE